MAEEPKEACGLLLGWTEWIGPVPSLWLLLLANVLWAPILCQVPLQDARSAVAMKTWTPPWTTSCCAWGGGGTDIRSLTEVDVSPPPGAFLCLPSHPSLGASWWDSSTWCLGWEGMMTRDGDKGWWWPAASVTPGYHGRQQPPLCVCLLLSRRELPTSFSVPVPPQLAPVPTWLPS